MASLPSGVRLAVRGHFCLGSSTRVFVQQGVWLKGSCPGTGTGTRGTAVSFKGFPDVTLERQQLTSLFQCAGRLKLLLLSRPRPSCIIYILEANTGIILVSCKVSLGRSCLYFSLGKDVESKWTELRNRNHV